MPLSLHFPSFPPPLPPPLLSYDQYMSRLKPFWLSSVQCLTGDDTIGECDRDSIIGYSASCSGASSFSVFNSAEVDCGECSSEIPFLGLVPSQQATCRTVSE